MSFPYVSRQAKKIPARNRIAGQKARERCVPFSYVAGNTGRNYVASRAVSAAHAGLHMIEGQRFDVERLTTIHALILVAREDALSRRSLRPHSPYSPVSALPSWPILCLIR